MSMFFRSVVIYVVTYPVTNTGEKSMLRQKSNKK